MPHVRVLILRAAGVNCDLETEHAWRLAGALPTRMHIRQIIENTDTLADFQILTIPGGFSYGDDVGAGSILAAQFSRHLRDAALRLVDAGGLILGVCNGFQVLVKARLLPTPSDDGSPRQCTITFNEPAGFQDRWVALRADAERCPFLEPGQTYEMPIGHGEGRICFSSDAAADEALRAGHGALRYVSAEATIGAGLPANPNGSARDLAGLCDGSGRILGLMPHPERAVEWTQHPRWTSLPRRDVGDGLAVFRNAVRALR
ncbi:MAG: Phosphoribosylformylglycinamidine synthase subunit PurQ [Phycisphaerae bacterium]|nr:Phosphoribosylformylglycinamidine synthase subunit PurQ [Phycisphaerae bacterium]